MRKTIVNLILIAGLFFSCTNKQPEITSADFQRLFSADSIQSMSVMNDESVIITTKSADSNGASYKLKISSSDQFKSTLDSITKDYKKNHACEPSYSLSFTRIGSSYFKRLGIIELVLTIGILALFLISVIDIVKHRFVSDIEKLIWILIVIFLPILGPILYLLIGRKHKVKDTRQA
jgi:ATP-dependent Zn protease